MATIQRDGYKIGDIVVVIPDNYYEDHPELTYANPVATFIEITDFLPNGWLRGRVGYNYASTPVADAHISKVRGQVVVSTFKKD